jgi:hypothetical protein
LRAPVPIAAIAFVWEPGGYSPVHHILAAFRIRGVHERRDAART